MELAGRIYIFMCVLCNYSNQRQRGHKFENKWEGDAGGVGGGVGGGKGEMVK